MNNNSSKKSIMLIIILRNLKLPYEHPCITFIR